MLSNTGPPFLGKIFYDNNLYLSTTHARYISLATPRIYLRHIRLYSAAIIGLSAFERHRWDCIVTNMMREWAFQTRTSFHTEG